MKAVCQGTERGAVTKPVPRSLVPEQAVHNGLGSLEASPNTAQSLGFCASVNPAELRVEEVGIHQGAQSLTLYHGVICYAAT